MLIFIVTYGVGLSYKRKVTKPTIISSSIETKPSYEYLKSITVEIRGYVSEDEKWMGTGTVVKV